MQITLNFGYLHFVCFKIDSHSIFNSYFILLIKTFNVNKVYYIHIIHIQYPIPSTSDRCRFWFLNPRILSAKNGTEISRWILHFQFLVREIYVKRCRVNGCNCDLFLVCDKQWWVHKVMSGDSNLFPPLI